MKFLSLTWILVAIAMIPTKAQTYFPDGTVIANNVVMTDINNNSYDLYALLNSGKHVLIDVSATWCSVCWAYHQTHVLDQYQNLHGNTGTVTQDAQVIFYEGDPNTTTAQLRGGSGSQGDWTAGSTYPLCNAADPSPVINLFVRPGQSSGFPYVFVVCADKKLYKVSTSLNTEVSLRNFIATKCGIAPTSINEIMDEEFSYSLYPNPTNSNTGLKISLNENNTVSYAVSNAIGQVIYNQSPERLSKGEHNFTINTDDYPDGIYYIELLIGDKKTTGKLVVSH